MEKELYMADTKLNLSFNDMVERTKKEVNKTTYYYNKNYIYGKTVQFEIFDGIYIVYHDLILKNPELFPLEETGFIKMNYCISGRCELEYKNHKVFYIGSGDFVVTFLNNEKNKHSFPLENYKGITITTNNKNLDAFLKTIFNDTGIKSITLLDKIKEYGKYMLLSNDNRIQKIMKEIIIVNDVFWKERAILKFAELILLLIDDDMEAAEVRNKYFERHVTDNVKLIKKEVTQNVENHITVKDISKKYNISPRTFSECFKEVYGKTYYSFIKEFRIKKAEGMLRNTNCTIGEIAITVGYQNASKFSKAFFDIMGVTPINFRKSN